MAAMKVLHLVPSAVAALSMRSAHAFLHCKTEDGEIFLSTTFPPSIPPSFPPTSLLPSVFLSPTFPQASHESELAWMPGSHDNSNPLDHQTIPEDKFYNNGHAGYTMGV